MNASPANRDYGCTKHRSRLIHLRPSPFSLKDQPQDEETNFLSSNSVSPWKWSSRTRFLPIIVFGLDSNQSGASPTFLIRKKVTEGVRTIALTSFDEEFPLDIIYSAAYWLRYSGAGVLLCIQLNWENQFDQVPDRIQFMQSNRALAYSGSTATSFTRWCTRNLERK